VQYTNADNGTSALARSCDQEQVPVMPESLAARVADAIVAESARRTALSGHRKQLSN
jgi:hypothetical protein